MKTIKFLFGCLLTSLFIIINSYGGEVKDKDGNSYKAVKIGNQKWMAENLNASTFINGNPISEAKTDKEWICLGEQGMPAWCYYRNNPENGYEYGKLYNWYAVNDPSGLCPVGWRVPTDDDWKELTDFLGGRTVAGGKLKKEKTWEGYNIDDTNETGFTALPGNFRYPTTLPEGLRSGNGSFWRYGNRVGYWWSSTKGITNTAWGYYLLSGSVSVGRSHYKKQSGFSVRCIRN